LQKYFIFSLSSVLLVGLGCSDIPPQNTGASKGKPSDVQNEEATMNRSYLIERERRIFDHFTKLPAGELENKPEGVNLDVCPAWQDWKKLTEFSGELAGLGLDPKLIGREEEFRALERRRAKALVTAVKKNRKPLRCSGGSDSKAILTDVFRALKVLRKSPEKLSARSK
jgi:hypothetical protein